MPPHPTSFPNRPGLTLPFLRPSAALDSNDFDSLTTLYREIFSLLTKTRDGDDYDGDVRRSVEREVRMGKELAKVGQ